MDHKDIEDRFEERHEQALREHDRQTLRAEAQRLIDMHPPDLRDDLEARLLAMTTAELQAYVDLRRTSERRDALWRRPVKVERATEDPAEGLAALRSQRPYLFRDEPVEHKRLRAGQDPRLTETEVDHPHRELPEAM